jgi:hypothetical protein
MPLFIVALVELSMLVFDEPLRAVLGLLELLVSLAPKVVPLVVGAVPARFVVPVVGEGLGVTTGQLASRLLGAEGATTVAL